MLSGKVSTSLFVALVAVGCGGREVIDAGRPASAVGATCVPGLQVACACVGGDEGAQICLPDGTFGACACPGDASSATGTSAASGSSSSSSGGGTGSGGGSTGRAPVELGIEANHVVADPVRGVFYATVGGAAAQHANSLVTIDTSGSVLASVFVGSDPLTMALSDDASTLWVSLRGSYDIRRVDLASGVPVPGEQFDLPPGDFGDLAYAGPMVVLPGTTGSVALSLHRENLSPSYAGSVVVDDGVPRPDQTAGHTGASRLTGGPKGWVFGFNNLHTGFGFYSLQVTPTGLDSTEHEDLVSGFYTDIVYVGDRVYATSGEVVDVSNPAAPTKAGEFSYGGLAVLPLGDRLLMLSADSSDPPVLRSLDPATFAQADSVTYPGLDLEGALDLVTTDGTSLAFVATGLFGEAPRLVLLTNPFES